MLPCYVFPLLFFNKPTRKYPHGKRGKIYFIPSLYILIRVEGDFGVGRKSTRYICGCIMNGHNPIIVLSYY
jgi:hypothetical protein